MIADPISEIKQICNLAYQPLRLVSEHGPKHHYSFDLDMGVMLDYNDVDIRYSPEHLKVFDDLLPIKGPVLYWFEVTSGHTSKDILAAFDLYKSQPGCKTVPALKSKLNFDSNILYVGKVKTQFWGRLITHLGFYKVDKTQGLQLFYWAKKIGLKLKVHVYQFESSMADLMPIVENGMAESLKPILGKHK